jgi:hypothetical protein
MTRFGPGSWETSTPQDQTGGLITCVVGDGGFVTWTGQLLGSRKERLLISGYGIDRIALAAGT